MEKIEQIITLLEQDNEKHTKCIEANNTVIKNYQSNCKHPSTTRKGPLVRCDVCKKFLQHE
jgi:hypothetical protein